MSERAMYEIEDNVPIPAIQRRGGGGRKSAYRFDDLNVDQMFRVPFGEDSPKAVARRVQVAKTQAIKRHPERHYKVRTLIDHTGMGVWRTK